MKHNKDYIVHQVFYISHIIIYIIENNDGKL